MRYLFYPRERGSYRGGRIERLSQKGTDLARSFRCGIYSVGDYRRVRDARLVAGDWEGCDDRTEYVCC